MFRVWGLGISSSCIYMCIYIYILVMVTGLNFLNSNPAEGCGPALTGFAVGPPGFEP